jgi:A/G-specific adenine glycosylase
VRSRPLCAACPLSAHCIARIEGRQAALPTARPKKIRPQKSAYVVMMVRDDGAVLLEHRPPAGIWGGLWTLPQFDERAAAQAWIIDRSGVELSSALPPYAHSFTHFDLTLHPLVVSPVPATAVHDGNRYCWYEPRQPAKIGLAKPAVELIRALTEQPAASLQRQSSLL